MINNTNLICPLPAPGPCVRECCNFWDEALQECAGGCVDTCDPLDATAKLDLDAPCVISFYEDYD